VSLALLRVKHVKFSYRKLVIAVLAGILISASAFRSLAGDSTGKSLSTSLIWTGQPDAEQKKGGYIAFRKHVQLADVSKPVTLHIFADARYTLWVNGQYLYQQTLKRGFKTVWRCLLKSETTQELHLISRSSLKTTATIRFRNELRDESYYAARAFRDSLRV
jgi:hypothetical protein